jgi:hypothetical protein
LIFLFGNTGGSTGVFYFLQKLFLSVVYVGLSSLSIRTNYEKGSWVISRPFFFVLVKACAVAYCHPWFFFTPHPCCTTYFLPIAAKVSKKAARGQNSPSTKRLIFAGRNDSFPTSHYSIAYPWR